jgi:uncharacterized protein (DUF1330 family)
MMYVTQLIYIVNGQEEIFNQFEALAIPIIRKYNGKLLLRVRPGADNVIEVNDIDVPYEMHLVAFDEESDFENFLRDDERKKFLHLKEQSVRSVLLIKGKAL